MSSFPGNRGRLAAVGPAWSTEASPTDAERVLAELRARPDAPVETMSAHVSADLADAVRLAAAVNGVSVAEEIRIALVERTKRVG